MKTPMLILAASLLQTVAFCQTCRTTLVAPTDVTVSVYSGFADSTEEVEPVSRIGSGTSTRHSYDLKPGNYHYIARGYDYLSLRKNFTVSGKSRTIDANPGRLGEKGYQHTEMTYAYTDEVIAKCLSVTDLNRRFTQVMTTPGFNPKKPVGEYATQREVEEYLDRLDRHNRNMYTYTAGYTTKGRRIPLAVFTSVDIKGKSLEEAAAAIVADGRPTVYLHAGIHGNENSACEGALAMCAELVGAYGERVLRSVNVVIAPRINCDGAQAWIRGTSVSSDMNRDNLLVANPEVRAAHAIYNAFQPMVVIDMHEASVRNYTDTEGYLDDAGITVGSNQNNSARFNDLQKEMMRYVEKTGHENGLRYWEYTQAGYSDQSPLHASHYYALRSSATFLVETTSRICQKSSSFARRTFTQFFAAHAIIEFTISNSERVSDICKADREHVASSQDPFILRYGQSEEAYTYTRTIFNLADGSVVKAAPFSVRYYEVPLITRSRPTAYVIPKDAGNVTRILEIAALNGITYEELPAGTELMLRQYARNPKWQPAVQPAPIPGKRTYVPDKTEKCVMIEPQTSVFDKGAYLFRTAQPSALVLMFLMEPDVVMTEQYPITLVQAGLLGLEDLYRLD